MLWDGSLVRRSTAPIEKFCVIVFNHFGCNCGNCVEGSRFCWSKNPAVYPSLVKAYKKKYYSDSNLLTHTDTKNCVGPRPLLPTLPPLNCGKATSSLRHGDRYVLPIIYDPVSFNHPFGGLFQNFLQPHQIALSRRGGGKFNTWQPFQFVAENAPRIMVCWQNEPFQTH